MKGVWAGLLILSTTAFGQRVGGLGAGLGGFGRGQSAIAGANRLASGGVVVVSPGAAFRSPGFRRQFGLPQLQPIPPLEGEPLLLRRGPYVGNWFGRLGSGSSFYPLVWPAYFGEGAYSSASEPTIIVVQPPPAAAYQPVAPAPPPTPARLVVNEYHFSEAAATPPPPLEQRAYVIALKDGSKDSAVACWVQGWTLHYIDSDGNERHVSLSEIDRALTQRLNREQQLPLSLPPGREPVR